MDERRIQHALDAAGLAYLAELNPHIAAQLDTWLRMLSRSERNLTAIRDAEAALHKHVVEPLVGRDQLIAADLPLPHGPMIDIGSGNGSPGLPIALCEPTRPAVLLDARAGAASFLSDVTAAIGAEQISVRCGRAEEAAHRELRETFVLAVSRAAAPPPAALELTLPYLQLGGVAAIWTGTLSADALRVCAETAASLGAVLTPIDSTGTDQPGILVATKQHHTDGQFPRRWKQIRRGPPAPTFPDARNP